MHLVVDSKKLGELLGLIDRLFPDQFTFLPVPWRDNSYSLKVQDRSKGNHLSALMEALNPTFGSRCELFSYDPTTRTRFKGIQGLERRTGPQTLMIARLPLSGRNPRRRLFWDKLVA